MWIFVPQPPLDRPRAWSGGSRGSPFFSPATCTSCSSDRSAIDAPQVHGFTFAPQTKTLKPSLNPFDCPVFVPLVEEIPHRRPWSVIGRKITPRGTRPKHPEDCVHNLTTTSWASTRLKVVCGEEILDQSPLGVGERVARNTRGGHASLRSDFSLCSKFPAFLRNRTEPSLSIVSIAPHVVYRDVAVWLPR